MQAQGKQARKQEQGSTFRIFYYVLYIQETLVPQDVRRSYECPRASRVPETLVSANESWLNPYSNLHRTERGVTQRRKN